MTPKDTDSAEADFAVRSVTQRNGFLDNLQIAPAELLATIRVARLSKLQEKSDRTTLRKFEREGLRSVEDIRMLALLGRNHPIGLSNSDLCDELGGSKGAMSIRLERLVKRDFVRQTPSANDGRLKINALTESGYDLAERAVASLMEVRVRMFASLEDSEVLLLGDLLARVIGELSPND